MAVRARLRLLPLLVLAVSSCGDDEGTFTDAPPRPDAAGTDGGSDLPAVTFPATLALGAGDCGAAASTTFDAENTGGGDLAYEITSSSSLVTVTPASGMIIAGTTTTFTVTAEIPADAVPGTPVTADLTIVSPALREPVVVAVTADPRGAVIALTPAAANFGDVQLGTSDDRTITVDNTGNAAATVAIAAPTDPAFAAAFTAGELAAGASRAATITYTPAAIGADSATAAITVTGPVCGTPPASLSMSASGIPLGGVAVTGNLAFGTQACGAAAGTTTVTITNYGAAEASWTALFLGDAEGDDTRYTVSPSSGTVAAGGSTTLTVTRLAIARPATPRAYDATLRVTTMGTSTVDHDLPASQLLQGAFLAATPATFDFGYAPSAQVLVRPITITNSGTASATATFSEGGAAQLTVPEAGATIPGGGGTATLSATYTATPTGVVSGTVTITAPNACSADVVVPIAMGDGAWAPLADSSFSASCDDVGATGSVGVFNTGTQALTISSCVDESGGLVASFDNLPLTLGSGFGSGSIQFTWLLPSPLRSGTTSATIRCATNEKFFATRELALDRELTGADLVIDQPDGPFTFTCGDPPSFRRLRVRNDGNQGASIFVNSSWYEPLYGVDDTIGVGPGDTHDTNGVGLGSGSGSGWCGFGSGDYNGNYQVSVGSGSNTICSIQGDTSYDVLLIAP